ISYELGVRHALRPAATVLLLADRQRPPFEFYSFRFLKYSLDHAGKPSDSRFPGQLALLLKESGSDRVDSPVFHMLPGLTAPFASAMTDSAERLVKSVDWADKIAVARKRGRPALEQIESELGDIAVADSSTVTDLFLSYRALSAWDQMIALTRKMAPALR